MAAGKHSVRGTLSGSVPALGNGRCAHRWLGHGRCLELATKTREIRRGPVTYDVPLCDAHDEVFDGSID